MSVDVVSTPLPLRGRGRSGEAAAGEGLARATLYRRAEHGDLSRAAGGVYAGCAFA